MEQFNIEWKDITSVKPYARNAKKHDETQIANVAESIKQFGWQQPIVCDADGVIIIGHCRLLAAKKLGLKKVPVKTVDNLSEEQVKKLRALDNKLNESDWDFDLLAEDIGELDFSGFDIDWGFGTNKPPDDKYTKISNIPQYEIKGEAPQVEELVETEKASELITRIQTANITDKEKDFLIKAAYRHNAFNYAKIAEYYANATKEMQELMEQSALVIIDIGNAIANGYAELSEKITWLRDNDEE